MLLAIDLETTGLAPQMDEIVEVGWTLLHDDFSDYRIGITHHVVTPTSRTFDLISSVPYVKNMHDQTGLLHDLNSGNTKDLNEIETEILDAIRSMNTDGENIFLFGSSVHFDLRFIEKNMPQLFSMLHHRVVDKSTITKFMEDFVVLPNSLVNTHEHRAAWDIEYDIRVARHLRAQLEIAGSAVAMLADMGYMVAAPEAQVVIDARRDV